MGTDPARSTSRNESGIRSHILMDDLINTLVRVDVEIAKAVGTF